MEKSFSLHELIEICEAVRVESKQSPDTRTMDLVLNRLIDTGVLFRVYITIDNDSWLISKERETLEFWSKKQAVNYVKEFNEKHGWKADGVDYLTAVI